MVRFGLSDQLSNRHGLAGKKQFVDQQILAFEERRIRRNAIAFGKNDNVAARHFPSRYSLTLAIADDERTRARQISKRLQDPFGARLLNDSDDDREIGEHEQDQRLMPSRRARGRRPRPR